MEEKYYEILRNYVNPNDCATVVKQLLSLHNVVGQSEQYFCEHEEVGYNKRCKQQCSDCNWIENL